MKTFKAGWIMALSSLLFGAQGLAATFVYVSNNEEGTIGVYTLQADGSLQPGARVSTSIAPGASCSARPTVRTS